MANMTSSGGRMARLLDSSGEAWYHVYNRLACDKAAHPLHEQPDAAKTLQRFIDFYTSAYRCEVATYTIMGNHYHLILRMESYRELSRETLLKHAKQIYPNTFEQTAIWSDEHWEQFNRRLFNLADLMRNIQQGFARWFNKSFARRGRFWADRFKSTMLYGEQALLECMQYVDLNPIRAGLVDHPEDYEFGVYGQRAQGQRRGFLDLRKLLSERTHAKAFETYRWQVYARGSVPSKEGQASIPEHVTKDVLESPFQLGRPVDGEAREHLRFFVDGLILGPKTLIAEWLGRLRKDGVFKRRQYPHTLADESEGFDLCSLREQRRHFEGGKQVSVRHSLPFL